MKAKGSIIGRLIVGCLLACCMSQNLYAQIPPPGGGETGTNYAYTPLPYYPNYAKYVGQSFMVLDTNVVAEFNTNLFNALVQIADDTGINPVLQILPYGDNCLIMRASHFDYSGESTRSFALVVNDDLTVPLYKPVNFTSTDTNNGWLVQGTIPHFNVTDDMFLLVSNINRTYNGFFRVIPYGGPEITLSGQSDYDVVSNNISIHADISDLSGVTNHGFVVTVAGLPARYSFDTNNNINISTPYAPNGLNQVTLSVQNRAQLFDTNNVPDNMQTSFNSESSLSLDFENATFLAFASDWCPPDVGTNYVYFYVDRARHISAFISKTNGQIVASFSGNTPGATYVSLPFTFTEANGVTPFSNDTYVVNFTVSAPTPSGGFRPNDVGPTDTLTTTNTIDKNGNIRPPNGCLLTYQWDDPNDPTWLNVNNHADTSIAGDLQSFYHDLYQSLGLTQYSTGDIGTNRNAVQCIPYNSLSKNWPTILGQLTNSQFSELTIAQAHGTGGFLGGAKYLPSTIDTPALNGWVSAYPQKDAWRLRKATIFACYSANLEMVSLGYPSWPQACGIRDKPIQMTSFMYKNCGLFFGDLLRSSYADNLLSGSKTTAEIAGILDLTFVCGKNAYPGACDPTYSWRYAVQSTVNRFDAFDTSKPSVAGYPDCIYTPNYDDELRALNTSHVKEP